jgi:hypothetical protein
MKLLAAQDPENHLYGVSLAQLIMYKTHPMTALRAPHGLRDVTADRPALSPLVAETG